MMAIDGKMKRDKMKIKGSKRRINLDYLFFFLFVPYLYNHFQSAQRDLAGAKNKQMMITVDLGIAKAKEVIQIYSSS